MKIITDNKSLHETESMVPANAMGASSSVPGTGGIDKYDPLIADHEYKKPKKKLRDVVMKRKPLEK